MPIRCEWVGNDPLYIQYHDTEWGVPVHDDRKLFEFLILEGAQAGLSWITILRKREGYQEAFNNFDPKVVARYDEAKIAELMQNSGIVRNRRKIEAAINNARLFLQIQEEFGSFDSYLWSFVEGKPVKNCWESISSVPASTPLSDTLSRALSKRGFKFVGTTICYSFMQAVGLVNDHIMECFRYNEV